MDIKGFKSHDNGFQWCLKPCKWLLMVKSPENGYKWFYEPCKWFFQVLMPWKWIMEGL